MSLPVSYFEGLYARDPDPWSFEQSTYERAKYDATLAALPRARYRNALEVGCSIGVLTARLAQRCDALLAVDGAASALDTARRRCAALPQVVIRSAWVPGCWPESDKPFDLILLSEVLYYLDQTDIGLVARHILGASSPDADILAVHWTGATDYPQSGDAATECFTAALGPRVRQLRHDRHSRYRLDLLRVHSSTQR